MKKAILAALTLLPVLSFAATFVVTNTNPGGNGSLIDALQMAAANGTSVQDTIAFNLPNHHTPIIVTAPLILTANLVVDGTTQPGKAFGQTNARIQIKGENCQNGFVINEVDNVAVYGIWFNNFSGAGCSNSALVVKNAKRIIIGKPGKGNCFTNNTQAIGSFLQPGETSQNEELILQSNRIGMDTTLAPDYTATNINLGVCQQLLFGGNTAAEGNRIGNGYVQVMAGNANPLTGAMADTIAFYNNAFGFDAFNGPLLSAIGLVISGTALKSPATVIINQNKIGMDDQANKIQVSGIKGNIIITNNYIGSLNTAVTPNDKVAGVYLTQCEKKDSIVVNRNTINGYLTAVQVTDVEGVTISKNVIYCNQKGIRHSNLGKVPVISLTGLFSTLVKGTTRPFSKVEIFSSSTCTSFCENGFNFLGEVYADDNGFFEFSGNLQNNISLTATAPDGTTGEFYGPKILTNLAIVKNATCNSKNGMIKGMKILQGNKFWWEDATGNQISTDTVLSNVGEGKYRMAARDQYSLCATYSPFFSIQSISKPATDSTFSASATACGKSKGQLIRNGSNTAGADNVWLDSLLKPIQYGGAEARNLAAGKYYYRVFLKEDTACFTQYGPFEIQDAKGPEIVADRVTVLPSECNGATGGIQNITLVNTTGNSYLAWHDSLGNTVGTTVNLNNVPGGRYRLLVKDGSFCDTLYSAFYTIPVKGGITIDTSRRNITPSNCLANTGAITQLTITGADRLQWINTSNNNVVGTQANLTNVAAGSYFLTAFNAIGCSDTSLPMQVPQQTFFPITYNQLTVVQPSCNRANGFVQPVGFMGDTLLYRFRWVDSVTTTTIANHTSLQNINAGTYQLIATDANGCSNTLARVTLLQSGLPVFNYSDVLTGGDTCKQSQGFVKNLLVDNGRAPYTWQWFKNASTLPFAQTANQLTGIDKGSYRATVTDSAGCTITSNPFIIGDFEKILAPPQASEVLILRNTPALLVITNMAVGSYALFDTLTAMLPLQIGTGPTMRTPPVPHTKTFYLQYKLGDCQSSRQAVLVNVFDKSLVTLANAFSPNGDGINDVWRLQVLGSITLKEWRVFNRNGQQVWAAANSNAGWDGSINGSPAPAGTYYYLLSATDNQGQPIQLSGPVTILR